MPPNPPGKAEGQFCIICSLWFDDWIAYQPWHAEFRTLYRGEYGVKLTGTGCTVHNNDWKVPNDEKARWDTMGDDSISLMNPPCRISDVYFFHEKCWQSFMKHMEKDEFDLNSLYKALESLPIPKEPWFFQYSHACETYEVFVIPTLEQVMQSPRVCPVSTRLNSRGPATSQKNSSDYFHLFPIEILEAIAENLQTQDVLSLRLASRAMVPIFANKTFWKSRFSINGERGFLYPIIQEEIKKNNNREIDWRLLYHCTCKLKCSLEFDYQIRIWESLRWLRDTIIARYLGKRAESKLPLDFRGRALQHYHNVFYPNIHTESVIIDRSLKRLVVSASQINATVYITGLEFIYKSRPSVLIGYKIPGAKIIENSTEELSDSSLYKYPGIQFTTKVIQDPDIEDWIGESSYDESNESDLRLDEITEVVGTFDHQKMLDLGVRGRTKRRNDTYSEDYWDRIVVPTWRKVHNISKAR